MVEYVEEVGAQKEAGVCPLAVAEMVAVVVVAEQEGVAGVVVLPLGHQAFPVHWEY